MWCYEMTPICNGIVCSAFIEDAATHRSAEGVFGNGLRRVLPEEVANVTAGHIDTLIGYTAAPRAIPVQSAADATFKATLTGDTLQKTELGEAVNYLTDNAGDYLLVQRNINRMINDYSTVQVAMAAMVLTQCENARSRVLAAAAVPKGAATSTEEYYKRPERAPGELVPGGREAGREGRPH